MAWNFFRRGRSPEAPLPAKVEEPQPEIPEPVLPKESIPSAVEFVEDLRYRERPEYIELKQELETVLQGGRFLGLPQLELFLLDNTNLVSAEKIQDEDRQSSFTLEQLSSPSPHQFMQVDTIIKNKNTRIEIEMEMDFIGKRNSEIMYYSMRIIPEGEKNSASDNSSAHEDMISDMENKIKMVEEKLSGIRDDNFTDIDDLHMSLLASYGFMSIENAMGEGITREIDLDAIKNKRKEEYHIISFSTQIDGEETAVSMRVEFGGKLGNEFILHSVRLKNEK
ncbi:MAG: hypothetical protein HOE80_02495 [Candidatus Magasanikbacteria bacterium]|jgi:hypothetical protein|nr:hypothetical protein [Candidatus Magasanikbacteria bacterium]MBT4071570.1 hypothetical protein [Candidatus Magasanikbacteria bacterium]